MSIFRSKLSTAIPDILLPGRVCGRKDRWSHIFRSTRHASSRSIYSEAVPLTQDVTQDDFLHVHTNERRKLTQEVQDRPRVRYDALWDKIHDGPFQVQTASGMANFTVGTYRVAIPTELRRLWKLDSLPRELQQVRVKFDLANGEHEHKWAKKATAADDASRLGIMVRFRDNEPTWIQSKSTSAVAVGNAFVDWKTGKIIDPSTHNWGADRFPFLGGLDDCISLASWKQYFGPERAMSTKPLEARWTLTTAFWTCVADFKRNTTDRHSLWVLDQTIKLYEELGFIPGGLIYRSPKTAVKLRSKAMSVLLSYKESHPHLFKT